MKRLIWIILSFLKSEMYNISLEQKHNIKIESNVTISRKIKHIGEHTFIARNVVIGPNTRSIGKFCSIGQDCLIGPNIHPMNKYSTSAKLFAYPVNLEKRAAKNIYQNRLDELNSKPTEIGNDVWIGAKSIILPGVVVNDGAVIGAGSVVTKNVEPYSIYAGNPARFVKKRFDDTIIAKLLELNIYESNIDLLSVFNSNYKATIDQLIEIFNALKVK